MSMPGSSKGGGQCLAPPGPYIIPGTPPVPAAMPNMANPAQAMKTSTKVKFVNKEVITIASEIPSSTGDAPGVSGAVSKLVMNKTTYKKGSSKVKAEGDPVAYQTSTTAHNGANANMPAGVQGAPSQTKVLVAP